MKKRENVFVHHIALPRPPTPNFNVDECCPVGPEACAVMRCRLTNFEIGARGWDAAVLSRLFNIEIGDMGEGYKSVIQVDFPVFSSHAWTPQTLVFLVFDFQFASTKAM